MWVHRLIREKGEGKVVELPSHRRRAGPGPGGEQRQGGGADGYGREYDDEDVVPRAKLDRIGMEYTHLLTSQLESQRVYFEELVSKAVDKAAKASNAAESAASQAQLAVSQLSVLRAEHDTLKKQTVPSLERALERESAKRATAADLARRLGKDLQEEKKVNEGLLARVKHLNSEMDAVASKMESLKQENAQLADMNRDLMMTISGAEAVRNMESDGRIEASELEEGTMVLPQEGGKSRKGKGRAKK
jgi:BRCA1-associated protein